VNISKTVKLQLMANRKSHMGFQLTPRSMTLNSLGISRHFSCFGASTGKRMKTDPYCQRRNCSLL